MPRGDGSLTKAEERTVDRALCIVAEWIEYHANDEKKPYAYFDVCQAHDTLCRDMWSMVTDWEDGRE